jgi:hypothetical protein
VDELEANDLNGDSDHVNPVSPKHEDSHIDGSPLVSHMEGGM